MKITEKSFVSSDKIEAIKNINGLDIIEQFLLFKGNVSVGELKVIDFKKLEDMALVHLGLTVNSTNRLYIGAYLKRFYNHSGLITENGRIKIPMDIWEKTKAINDRYKK